jgi:hypothetical protein
VRPGLSAPGDRIIRRAAVECCLRKTNGKTITTRAIFGALVGYTGTPEGARRQSSSGTCAAAGSPNRANPRRDFDPDWLENDQLNL